MQPPTRDDEPSRSPTSHPRKRPRLSYTEDDEASKQVLQSIKAIEGTIIQWCAARGLPLNGGAYPSQGSSSQTSISQGSQRTVAQNDPMSIPAVGMPVAILSPAVVPLCEENVKLGSTVEEPIYIGSSDDEFSSDFVHIRKRLTSECEPGQVVVIHDLHPTISYADFLKMLSHHDIYSSMISQARKYQCGSLCLRFNHDRDADAVFAQLISVRTPFPWKGSQGWERVQRWPENGQPPSTFPVAHRVSLDRTQVAATLYGNLNTDVYDEHHEVPSSPPRPQPILIPQMNIDRQTVLRDSWEEQTSSEAEIYEDDPDSDDSSEYSANVTGRAYNLSSQPIFPKSIAPRQGRAPERCSTAGSSHIVPSSDGHPDRPNEGIPRVPNTPYNRARRVLVPSSSTLPLITLSMRADAQFFHRQERYRISSYSLPFKGDYRHVEDACIIGDTAIVGYSDGPFQVSLIRLIRDQPPIMTELGHRPHSQPANHKPERKGGAHLSCLSPAPSQDRLRFYTGGYDKTVRLWTLNENGNDATSEEIIATAAVPFTLAHRDHTVLFSEGRRHSVTESLF